MSFSYIENSLYKLSLLGAVTMAAATAYDGAIKALAPLEPIQPSLEQPSLEQPSPEQHSHNSLHRGTSRSDAATTFAYRASGRLYAYRGTGRLVAYRGTGRVHAYRGTGRLVAYRASERGLSNQPKA